MNVDSRRTVVALLPLLVAGGVIVAGPGRARAEAPRLFVLPVRSDSWLEHDERLLDARVALALTRARRVRPMGTRDLSPGARRVLPLDLAECVTPGCLRTLGQATGAARVLALELFDDGDGRVLFATLFNPGTGEAVDRRELPRGTARLPTKVWAEEVAGWVGESTASVRPVPPRRPVAPPGVSMSVGLDPQQSAQPEAQALLAQLKERLAARGRPTLALPGDATEVSHRAVITVEKFAVSVRPHHVHHYRTGVLAANLTIVEARTGTVIFTRRAQAEHTSRARYGTDQTALAALVSEVVHRWTIALEDGAVERLLHRPQL